MARMLASLAINNRALGAHGRALGAHRHGLGDHGRGLGAHSRAKGAHGRVHVAHGRVHGRHGRVHGASMARIDASMARPWPAIARLGRSWGASGRPRSRMERTVGVLYAALGRAGPHQVANVTQLFPLEIAVWRTLIPKVGFAFI